MEKYKRYRGDEGRPDHSLSFEIPLVPKAQRRAVTGKNKKTNRPIIYKDEEQMTHERDIMNLLMLCLLSICLIPMKANLRSTIGNGWFLSDNTINLKKLQKERYSENMLR